MPTRVEATVDNPLGLHAASDAAAKKPLNILRKSPLAERTERTLSTPNPSCICSCWPRPKGPSSKSPPRGQMRPRRPRPWLNSSEPASKRTEVLNSPATNQANQPASGRTHPLRIEFWHEYGSPDSNTELAAESLEHRLFIALAGGTSCWSLGLLASSGFTRKSCKSQPSSAWCSRHHCCKEP